MESCTFHLQISMKKCDWTFQKVFKILKSRKKYNRVSSEYFSSRLMYRTPEMPAHDSWRACKSSHRAMCPIVGSQKRIRMREILITNPEISWYYICFVASRFSPEEKSKYLNFAEPKKQLPKYREMSSWPGRAGFVINKFIWLWWNGIHGNAENIVWLFLQRPSHP